MEWCKYVKCGKTRNEYHSWQNDICTLCGTERAGITNKTEKPKVTLSTQTATSKPAPQPKIKNMHLRDLPILALSLTLILLFVESFTVAQAPLVYDKTVPLGKTCTLLQGTSIKVRKFNGKTVNWKRKIIIPAGTHEFVIDYSWEGQTINGITARYTLIAGHDYRIEPIINNFNFNKTLQIGFMDITVNESVANVEWERKKAMHETIKTRLPKEATEPTQFEGTWVCNAKSLSFSGNSWQYFRFRPLEKGLFIIEGDTITFFKLQIKSRFSNGTDSEWFSIIENNVPEYRFVFEGDSAFRMTIIKGIDDKMFDEAGPFYRDNTKQKNINPDPSEPPRKKRR